MSPGGRWKLITPANHVTQHNQLEERFVSAQGKGCPVAAAIVEPIQAEGGEF